MGPIFGGGFDLMISDECDKNRKSEAKFADYNITTEEGVNKYDKYKRSR